MSAADLPEQPLDLSRCPVCGKPLQGVRCSGPKGCGRTFELLPLLSKVEITGAGCSPQAIRPRDTLAVSPTRVARTEDGSMRRVKVRS